MLSPRCHKSCFLLLGMGSEKDDDTAVFTFGNFTSEEAVDIVAKTESTPNGSLGMFFQRMMCSSIPIYD